MAAGAGCLGLRDRRVCCVGLADICVVVQQPAAALARPGRLLVVNALQRKGASEGRQHRWRRSLLQW